MKLVSFQSAEGKLSWGILQGKEIADLGAVVGARHPTLKAALSELDTLAQYVDRAPHVPLEVVRLLPPVPQPDKILCVGLNYKTHIAETGREPPVHPMLFPRYPSSLVGHGQPLVRPKISSMFDYEGELAFVIGKRGRHISTSSALDHVAGYACFNDGSIRDWQRHTSQFLPGKNFCRSGSFGPWLVTPDEVGDVGELTLVTRLNGHEMQRARLDDLVFGVADLIAYISTFIALEPGDVIATGTTGGVGLFRDPQVWMKPGDTVEVEIERLGALVNTIEDEPAE